MKDTWHGYNCHCAATTCTLFSIAIHCSKENQPIFYGIFRICVSRNPYLQHVILFSDIGYWTPTLVYCLLACRAFHLGSVLANDLLPRKKENGQRIFLETKGPPSFVLKTSSKQQQTLPKTYSWGLSQRDRQYLTCNLIDQSWEWVGRWNFFWQSKEQVNPTTATKDLYWKYGRCFSLTSATPYDVCNLCVERKCCHLYAAKSHFPTLKANLDWSLSNLPVKLRSYQPEQDSC